MIEAIGLSDNIYATKTAIMVGLNNIGNELDNTCTYEGCTFAAVDGAFVLTANEGVSQVSFQNTKAKGQVRVTEIEVVYAAA